MVKKAPHLVQEEEHDGREENCGKRKPSLQNIMSTMLSNSFSPSVGLFGSLETEHNNNSNNKYLVEWSTMVFWSFEYIKRAASVALSPGYLKEPPPSILAKKSSTSQKL